MTHTMWPELPSRLQLPNQHEQPRQPQPWQQQPPAQQLTRLSLQLPTGPRLGNDE